MTSQPGDSVALQIVGGGKMGEALLAGILAASPDRSIRVVEALPARVEELQSAYPSITVTGSLGAAEGTVLAVKPPSVPGVAAAVVAAGGGRLLSIAAGVTLATIEAAAGPGVAVLRAMPNTPALVGMGASALSGGASATDADVAWAEEILGSVGVVTSVAESLLSAVTGMSGSGPAYVFVFLDALIEGGVAAGLPRDVAEILAAQTIAGSAALFQVGTASPGELRAQVTSPGGTTAQGLRVLEQRALRAAVIDAVLASRDRAEELA